MSNNGLFFSVISKVIAAFMSEFDSRKEKNCTTTFELLVGHFCRKSLSNTERVTLSLFFSGRQDPDSDLCGLFYVSHAALLFSNNTFISGQRDRQAALDSPGPKRWNQAAKPDFDAESKLLWQRFTTGPGQLSEAISVHLWILRACLCLRASGPVSLRCTAKDKSLVTPFVWRSIAKPSSITCVCMCACTCALHHCLLESVLCRAIHHA